MKSKVQLVSHSLILTGALTLGILAVGIGRSLSSFQKDDSTMGGGSISSNTANPMQISQAKTIRPTSGFNREQIDYFMEVAIGSEYNQESIPKIRKWSGNIRIQVLGKPTQADLRTLETVISELNTLANGAIRLQLVDRSPNIRMHFAPETQFRQLEPAYVPVNFGFFVTRWNHRGIINSANILITTTGVTQQERSHLIREELTQSLGLMRDSYRYANSMFYQPWTDITRFSEIDKAVIRMLYMPELKPGMTKAEVLNVLNAAQARSR